MKVELRPERVWGLLPEKSMMKPPSLMVTATLTFRDSVWGP